MAADTHEGRTRGKVNARPSILVKNHPGSGAGFRPTSRISRGQRKNPEQTCQSTTKVSPFVFPRSVSTRGCFSPDKATYMSKFNQSPDK
jgi:hypothetical protein